MSFAKKMARKKLNKFKKLVDRSVDLGQRAEAKAEYASWKNDRRVIRQTEYECTVVFLYVIYKQHGFCYKRLKRIYDRAMVQLDCFEEGRITVQDLENLLAEEVGLEFNKNDVETYQLNMESRLRYNVLNAYMAAFMFACYEEFGWKKKRLQMLIEGWIVIAQGVKQGHLDFDAIVNELAEKAKTPLIKVKGGVTQYEH